MITPLKNLPERLPKPRQNGITMVMDKGLSLRQAEDLLSVANQYIDLIKLGWSTGLLTPQLFEKLNLYRSAGIEPFLGGTLFEIFLVRNQLDDYQRLLDKAKLSTIELSDGSLDIAHEKKLEYIHHFAKNYKVLSEVGSKDANKIMAPYLWVESIDAELNAGSWKVITESRESGTVGVFRPTGEVRTGLIDEILHKIPAEKLLFEAPKKEQQVWFINLLGANVNLGNIAPDEAIGLETLRLGLRGDTFHTFLK